VTSLQFGQPAPVFTLPSTTGTAVSLGEFRGHSDVVLIFYCYDFGRI
jgi:peroxiredoxin